MCGGSCFFFSFRLTAEVAVRHFVRRVTGSAERSGPCTPLGTHWYAAHSALRFFFVFFSATTARTHSHMLASHLANIALAARPPLHCVAALRQRAVPHVL